MARTAGPARVLGLRRNRTSLSALCVGLLGLTFVATQAPAQVSIDDSHHNPEYPAGPPYHRVPDLETFKLRDLRLELRNKTNGTFVVASAGDVHISQPVVKRMSPQLLEALRSADVTVGNLEQNIGVRPKDLAQDLAAMGFDMMAPGEEDTAEAQELWKRYLGEVDIKIAGAGPTLTEARRPALKETARGMVAFLHACPGDYLCGESATNGGGPRPAKPGVNGLGLTVWNTVTQQQFDQLLAIRDSILARRTEPGVLTPSGLPPAEAPGRLILFGVRYMVAEKPGEIHYELTPADEQAQILEIRNAKEISDFTIFHMHVHQNRFAFQQYSLDNYPPDFMQPFIHKLIDNGLDMYVGSGNHSMQGIEIYKGRPIFYNQGNVGNDVSRPDVVNPNPQGLTGPEFGERMFSYWMGDNSDEAYIARTTYKDGRLAEIRLYPVDSGLGTRPWSQQNIPMTPSPARARAILEKLQKYSEPFGTRISIENNIGIIRVPPEATVDVGDGLDIPGRRVSRK